MKKYLKKKYSAFFSLILENFKNYFFYILSSFSQLRKDHRATTAIEFAILAPIFFFALFIILETCLSFTAKQSMINAAETIARKIKIGTINPNYTNIHDYICKNLIIAHSNCKDLKIDLKSYPDLKSFLNDATKRIQDKNKKNFPPYPVNFTVSHSPAGSFNILSVYSPWRYMINVFNFSFLKNNKTEDTHYFEIVWQNENF